MRQQKEDKKEKKEMRPPDVPDPLLFTEQIPSILTADRYGAEVIALMYCCGVTLAALAA